MFLFFTIQYAVFRKIIYIYIYIFHDVNFTHLIVFSAVNYIHLKKSLYSKRCDINKVILRAVSYIVFIRCRLIYNQHYIYIYIYICT